MKESMPFAVTFAGVPGTSKTPIANYLSCEFNLPILSTDQIRYEVREDLQVDDINMPEALTEYEKRRRERFERLLTQRKSFILDGSMDRRWSEVKERFEAEGYHWFMINMQLSKAFLLEFYNKTGRTDWAKQYLDHYLNQHNEFLVQFKTDVTLEITDDSFVDRLKLSAEGLQKFLAEK